MFKLKSPFLQDFIENNLISFSNNTSEQDQICHLQKRLEASTKHFLKIGQPISLFNYLEETLVQK